MVMVKSRAIKTAATTARVSISSLAMDSDCPRVVRKYKTRDIRDI